MTHNFAKNFLRVRGADPKQIFRSVCVRISAKLRFSQSSEDTFFALFEGPPHILFTKNYYCARLQLKIERERQKIGEVKPPYLSVFILSEHSNIMFEYSNLNVSD